MSMLFWKKSISQQFSTVAYSAILKLILRRGPDYKTFIDIDSLFEYQYFETQISYNIQTKPPSVNKWNKLGLSCDKLRRS